MVVKSQQCGNGAQQPILPPGDEPSAPRERPILFSAPMVRGLLDGRKTQTRRIVKGMALEWLSDSVGFAPEFVADPSNHLCPYGVPGDVLWVREAWRMPDTFDNVSPQQAKAMVVADQSPNVFYAADGSVRSAGAHTGRSGKTRVSIHMPRWASRISLRVTDVRVERLNEISEEDATAEGAPCGGFGEGGEFYESPHGNHRCGFAGLWEHINGPGSWEATPWVWAVSFEVITPLSAHDTSSATDPLRDADT